MKPLFPISLIAILISSLAALKAGDESQSATSFTESFDGPELSNQLSIPSGYVFGGAALPVGSIQNLDGSLPRRFITTTASDFNTVDFQFEITTKVTSGGPENGAYIGLGASTSNIPGSYPEPHTSIYFRIFPAGFGGTVDVGTSPSYPNWTYTNLSTAPHPAEGNYRVRIRKVGDEVTLSCMTNYSGQPFVASYSISKSLTNNLSFLNQFNSRLFFGVQGSGTTFDDLDIIAGCTPHRAIARATLANGFLVGSTLLDPGCGYTNAPLVVISGGGGFGAGARATIANGKVSSLVITNAGCCYSSLPKIEFASPPFVPELNIAVSKVKLFQKVVLGRRYVLESSFDGVSWSWFGTPFTAQSERLVTEADVDTSGRLYRIRELP